MAKDQALDAFIELTPSKKMTVQIAGETLDAKRGESSGDGKAVIEISSFRFGDAKSLAKAKEADKKAAARGDDDDDGDVASPPITGAKRTGNVEEDYRFQVTKQIDKSTPFFAQAYFSNSYKPKRHEYNSFAEAKIVVRKLGSNAKNPNKFFSLSFRGVYVVGYEIQTEGPEPPEETIDFCFQTCEMSYKPQTHEGEMVTAIVLGWNFVAQKPLSIKS